MSHDVFVVWDESVTEYNFGPSHPMHPLRLDLTAKLATDLNIFDHPRVHLGAIPQVDDAALKKLHSADFVEAVKDAGRTSELSKEIIEAYGVGTEDVPRFDGIHEASGRLYMGSIAAAQAVIKGSCVRAVNFCGGMHHAMPGKAAGFCVYNDVAAAVQEFLDNGYERIVYIDLDAHHGDGVEHFFWDDPRVLTVSLHENGRFLFPGTGFAADIGGLQAAASAMNVALPPRTSDADWLRALDATVPHVLREFKPQVIVSQHGCDGHRLDPLTHLRLSVDAMRRGAEWVRDLADELCDGKWVATGGGGYAIIDVVPRTWSQIVAIAAGIDLEPGTEIPQRWRDYVMTLTGREAPVRMTDGGTNDYQPWTQGYDPEADIDRAVIATRKAIFPFYGLDPYYD